jgi:hypothetical protein
MSANEMTVFLSHQTEIFVTHLNNMQSSSSSSCRDLRVISNLTKMFATRTFLMPKLCSEGRKIAGTFKHKQRYTYVEAAATRVWDISRDWILATIPT